ncbi:hypothetical protein [Infirmifilum sp. NZ]|uniref:hypothetical protein n=1 Tax=Infirmifilum sp. NZ TaxID=2926850 RepID=UPI00279B6789|nr:hypothetical protein [Infirmifilum sp. NZ]UNQ74004.1 hypothetical protein MOV14_03045 [Infirmifilum sp. NZ]
MSQRASRRTCPQGYFVNKVADIIARGARLEELQAVALEIVVSEVHLRGLLEVSAEEGVREDVESFLEEIDRAKKMIYRAYRVFVSEAKRTRVVKWR